MADGEISTAATKTMRRFTFTPRPCRVCGGIDSHFGHVGTSFGSTTIRLHNLIARIVARRAS